MNDDLKRLATEIGLDDLAMEHTRLAFSAICADRISHLLEEPEVQDCLAILHGFPTGTSSRAQLEHARARSAHLANHHGGSRSLDGCGHAAVSATYAVANALAGKAIETASYAAYASAYASGGSAAVADRASFKSEFAWQLTALSELTRRG
jgi:hypothetical protein